MAFVFFVLLLMINFQNCGNINLNDNASENSSLNTCADPRIFDIGISYDTAQLNFEFFLRENSSGLVGEFDDGDITWTISGQAPVTTKRPQLKLGQTPSCRVTIIQADFKNSCGENLTRATQVLDPRCEPLPPEPEIQPPVVTPPVLVTPPVQVPADTTPIKSKNPIVSWGCLNYFGDLEFWNPTTPIPAFIHPTTGAQYSVRIAGAATIPNSCDRQSFDPILTGSATQKSLDVRHLKFAGVVAFRVRVPAGKSNATFGYNFMNIVGAPAGNLYSVSKYPGEINPAKASSPDYCYFGGNAASFRSSNVNDAPAGTCRIRENEIYFFNVFSPTGIDDDGFIDVGERMALDLRFNL